uniref:Intraflagellar transport protein 56 n=1 Tax=Ciona intestinalis TaxID=7719 RepID=F7AIU3_CIOIN
MILSRQKPATCIKVNHGIKKAPKMPVLDDFLDKRDYVGAITLLEFQRRCGKVVPHLNMWIAYCWFHLADYKKAYAIYKKMIEKTDCDPQALINLACCCMYLGLYDEAYTVLNTPQQDNFSILQSRLLFHLSHKLNKERNMMVHMSRLEDIDDKCSYYSLHFMRGNYEEAINSFKHLLNLDKNFAALKVYLAMCYFKLEYYDVAQDYLSEYLQQHPGSVLCSNLRACIFFRLYNGKAAEAELRS